MEPDRKCLQCSREFPAYRRQRYCSQKCCGLHHRNETARSRTCKKCGVQFMVRFVGSKVQHCSIRCRPRNRKSRANPNKKPRESRPCEWCHSPFEYCPTGWQKNRRFCGWKCSRAFNSASRRDPTTKKGARKNRADHRRVIGKCERCGWNEEILVLHVHHRDHDRTNDVPENWEVLCPNCHKLHHLRDKLTLGYTRKVW